MGRDISSLCAERHYMGSSSSGRYATDRNVRPSYDRLPTPQELERALACRIANRTRYVREYDALWWVAECEDAKAELAAGAGLLDRLRVALDEDPADLADETGPAWTHADFEAAAELLEERQAATLLRRKQASRELRLLGVSPKAQARIAAELRLRASKR